MNKQLQAKQTTVNVTGRAKALGCSMSEESSCWTTQRGGNLSSALEDRQDFNCRDKGIAGGKGQ